MLDPNRWSDKAPPNPLHHDRDANKGQKILALIRSLENEDDEHKFSQLLEDASELFITLIRTSSTKGLLQGDIQKAEEVLSSGSGETNQDSLKKKRGRRRGPQKTSESLGSAATSDESLMISAVIRISGWDKPRQQSALRLARLGADFCTAVSEHIKSRSSQEFSTIGLAEYDLMSSSGIALLKGLCKTSSRMLSIISHNLQIEALGQPEVLLDTRLDGHDEVIDTVQSCLKATASLVSLFATKLSRSSGLVSDLQKLGLTALTLPCHDTQTAASKLLAALPLTGAMFEKKSADKSIGEQWSDFLMDAVSGLLKTLQTMAPVSRKMEPASNAWQVSHMFGLFLGNVQSFFHERLPQEEQRASAFRVLIHGLSRLILATMARDCRCPRDDGTLLDARISVGEILNLLECMLSFSFASESLFFATKKRLRHEAIEGGVLSPASVVEDVASYVKLLGHRIFDALISAVGYPPLLPYSTRILQMVSDTLITSSSLAVQRTIDSIAASSQMEGKRQRWHHTSILLRAKAIQSFGIAVSLFGLDPTRDAGMGDASSWMTPHNSSGAEKCITVVGGCLLEQLGDDGKDCSDWGTLEERVDLVETSVVALESILSSCGGFVSLAVRVLVDSITAGGLDNVVSQDASPVASSASVKIAILRLGSTCVSTPWSSGASSSLRDKLVQSSLQCRTQCPETGVAAANALRLCESLGTPRVPALHVDKQLHEFSASTKPVSAGSLLKDIEKVKDELAQREATEDPDSPAVKAKEEEDGQRKRRKKVEPIEQHATNDRRENSIRPTKEQTPPALTAEQPRKNDQPTKDEANATDDRKQKDVSSEKTATNSDDGDEEDFLPGIIDDAGPDEEDV